MADGRKLGALLEQLRGKGGGHHRLRIQAAAAIESLVIEADDAWLYREEDIQRLSAENSLLKEQADTNADFIRQYQAENKTLAAKEEYALSHLEKTLAIEKELRATNKLLKDTLAELKDALGLTGQKEISHDRGSNQYANPDCTQNGYKDTQQELCPHNRAIGGCDICRY